MYFSCDFVTNPHPKPTDLKYKIQMQQMQILECSVTSLPAILKGSFPEQMEEEQWAANSDLPENGH